MKAVLMSTQPKWCELIASGKKTIEVRKDRPKLETPFKVYIYCTKSQNHFLQSRDNMFFYCENKDFIGGHGAGLYQRLNGKVIGEFVCDKTDFFFADYYDNGSADLTPSRLIFGLGNANSELAYLDKCCLTHDELFDYIISEKYGYGWHITDLKIYDKPKELSEFYQECKGTCIDTAKKILCLKIKTLKTLGGCDRKISLKRPPQSWCYVEELQNG